MTDTLGILQELEETLQLPLTRHQKSLIERYLQLLRKWRRRVNLSAVEGTRQWLSFHFFEAFWAVEQFQVVATRMADIGSGAGFPGVAMKLYSPSIALTVMERREKKAMFLLRLSRELELDFEIFAGDAALFPRWGEIRLAAMRALRPDRRLLQRLAESGVSLLLFHGERVEAGLENWKRIRTCLYPLSRERRITLFQPPGGQA